MTDVLGGLDVNAEQASSGRGYSTVHKGVNHFDGAAALGFVRERRLPVEWAAPAADADENRTFRTGSAHALKLA